MNREQLEELSALHALGLLEGEELRAFEREIATNPEAAQLAASLASAAAGLTMSIDQVEPPAALKSRVMAALPDRKRGTTAAFAPPVAEDSAPSAEVGFRWLPWSLAACFALVAGLVVKSNLDLRSQLTAREQANADLSTQLAQVQKQADLDSVRVAILASLLQDVPNASAVCVWNAESQEGVLTVANLPAAQADQDYQLWVVDPRNPELPVDGGVFNTATDGTRRFVFKPKEPVTGVLAFAVSRETKGGVPKAQGPMVMSGAPQP